LICLKIVQSVKKIPRQMFIVNILQYSRVL